MGSIAVELSPDSQASSNPGTPSTAASNANGSGNARTRESRERLEQRPGEIRTVEPRVADALVP